MQLEINHWTNLVYCFCKILKIAMSILYNSISPWDAGEMLNCCILSKTKTTKTLLWHSLVCPHYWLCDWKLNHDLLHWQSYVNFTLSITCLQFQSRADTALTYYMYYTIASQKPAVLLCLIQRYTSGAFEDRGYAIFIKFHFVIPVLVFH